MNIVFRAMSYLGFFMLGSYTSASVLYGESISFESWAITVITIAYFIFAEVFHDV